VNVPLKKNKIIAEKKLVESKKILETNILINNIKISYKKKDFIPLPFY
jgi:hypothetical protein